MSLSMDAPRGRALGYKLGRNGVNSVASGPAAGPHVPPLLHFSAMPLKHGRHAYGPLYHESQPMAEIQVCAAADVPENGVISREVGDELVAIYNIDGTFYATEARCTHGLADLADGTLDGDEIECSFHFGAFHVPSGKATKPPASSRSRPSRPRCATARCSSTSTRRRRRRRLEPLADHPQRNGAGRSPARAIFSLTAVQSAITL